MKKLLVVIIVLGVLGGLGWWGVRALQGLAQTDQGPPVVRTEVAAFGALVELVSAPGQIEPRTRVSISSRVPARIDALPFKEGDQVKGPDKTANTPGSVLVKLDSTELEANLRQAEARKSAEDAGVRVALARLAAQKAQIEATRVSLADAQRDLRIQKQLFETKDVSQTTVDTAQAKVDGLQAQLRSAEYNLSADEANMGVLNHNLEAAEAEIKKAKESLSYTTITSPIDGIITRINAKVGEVVITGTMNNPGTVILEVADLSQMLMVARVDETSIARVQKGQTAIVRIQAYPDETFEGIVDTVALSYTDEKDGSKYFKTEILLKDKGKRVLSGLTADADIETMRHKDVIRVPSQAVVGRLLDDLPADVRNRPEVDKSKTMTTAVFRVIDGKAVITPVSIGPSDDLYTIIKSGLSPGERVITGPFKVLETLKNDQAVKDERPATQPAATQPASRPATAPVTQGAAT